MVRSCNVLAFVAMEVEAFLETQVLPFFFCEFTIMEHWLIIEEIYFF